MPLSLAGFAERQHAAQAPGSSGAKTATSTWIWPRLLPDAMKPGIQCVTTHSNRGFMTFQLPRRTGTVMLMVPVCPESRSLDVPHGRGPPAYGNTVLVVLM
jgi:hypothetical protein